MNSIISKLRKSLVIGVSAVILLSAVSQSVLPQSWFITGTFFSDEDSSNSVTVINDDSEDVEFGFGLFDLIARLFD